MRHEEFQQWIVLSIYEELEEHEKELLEEHLAECPQCRITLEQTRHLLEVLDSQDQEAPEELLREARAQLRGALREEGHPRERKFARLSNWSSVYRTPLAAAASLVLGIAVGYLLFNGGGSSVLLDDPFSTPGITFSDIQLVDPDASDGIVEVAFQAVRPVQLRGQVEDPRIQQVLAQALLRSGNPGVRLQAVDVFEEEKSAYDPQVQDALILSLKYDENAGVRRRSLTTLQKMPADPRFRQALLYVLMNDPNPGMRVAAIDALDSLRDHDWQSESGLLKALEERLAKEENDYVRLRSKAFLEEVRYQ